MSTAVEERGAGEDRDLVGPITQLVLIVAVLVAATFWVVDPIGRSATAAPTGLDPVAVRIPAIGVQAAVGPLYIDDDGVLPPPDSFDDTGWWHAGPRPGEPGPAVIAGHVDSRDGPAVFYRLAELDPGDEIIVDRADGSSATFLAERTEQHAKDAFPTGAVYGDTPEPVLRLVTCGGVFDQAGRSYRDNIIVYAAQARGQPGT